MRVEIKEGYRFRLYVTFIYEGFPFYSIVESKSNRRTRGIFIHSGIIEF